MEPKLFPQPKSCQFYDTWADCSVLQNVIQIHNPELSRQGYILTVGQTEIRLESAHPQGAYYGQLTLDQLADQQPDRLRQCRIFDEPDFEIRGVMIDVGRFCLPTLARLKRIVDILSAVKINHLELYLEGHHFAYASHPQVWKNRDVLTGPEIQALDAYCKERFIDLVPCQNGFGHMKQWLARDEYRHLGAAPDGMQMPWGYEEICSTLNPELPESFELTKSLYFDLIPWFSSEQVNICFDETFELKKLAGDRAGEIYFDYLLKTYHAIKERYPEKKLLFWADIVGKDPQYLRQLPADLIPLKWQYTPSALKQADFDAYQASGHPFYVCPSTQTHCTIVGKTDAMKANISETAVMGKAAGAIGLLNTKWGDIGNWDGLTISYLPYVYGAGKSWNVEAEPDAESYVNRYVFRDTACLMGRIAAELGDFYHFDPKISYNGNGIIRTLYYYQLDGADHDLDFVGFPPYESDYFDRVLAHLEKYEALLSQTQLQCPDRELVLEEYRLAIRMLRHGANLGNYRLQNKEDRTVLWQLYDDIRGIIADYSHCWYHKNKNVGLDESLYKLRKLESQYQTALGAIYVKI